MKTSSNTSKPPDHKLVITKFNPYKLKTGNVVERALQKANWLYGENNSIYVRWIPSEQIHKDNDTPNKKFFRELSNFFEEFGKLKNIELVPTQCDVWHDAYIHYERFYTDEDSVFARNVVTFSPAPYPIIWDKNCVFDCYINAESYDDIINRRCTDKYYEEDSDEDSYGDYAMVWK